MLAGIWQFFKTKKFYIVQEDIIIKWFLAVTSSFGSTNFLELVKSLWLTWFIWEKVSLATLLKVAVPPLATLY